MVCSIKGKLTSVYDDRRTRPIVNRVSTAETIARNPTTTRFDYAAAFLTLLALANGAEESRADLISNGGFAVSYRIRRLR